MNAQLVRQKALQNIAGNAVNIWDVLIENPMEPGSIVTIEQFVGKQCPKSLETHFTSGFMQNMLKRCDEEVVAKSMGFQSFLSLERHYSC